MSICVVDLKSELGFCDCYPVFRLHLCVLFITTVQQTGPVCMLIIRVNILPIVVACADLQVASLPICIWYKNAYPGQGSDVDNCT